MPWTDGTLAAVPLRGGAARLTGAKDGDYSLGGGAPDERAWV
jgi:hypothetical protein